jgi:hypothetical protein
MSLSSSHRSSSYATYVTSSSSVRVIAAAYCQFAAPWKRKLEWLLKCDKCLKVVYTHASMPKRR